VSLLSDAPDRLSPRAALWLALLAVLPFLNGLPNDFTYDDKLIIRDNDRIASLSAVVQVFTTQYFGGSLASAQNYRPLVLLTYAVQRWIHGNRPFAFRAVNILLHAGTTVLLAMWLLALGFARGPGLATASLFAVVTIHVEAVTGLVGRAETLAGFLILLAALLWLKATEGGGLAPGVYAGAVGVFLAALFVKENAVVLPGVVVLGELFRGGRGRSPREAVQTLSGRARLAFLGLLLPVGILFAVRHLVLRGFLISREASIFDLENPLVTLSPALRAANAATLVFRYVAKTLVPFGLCADHSAFSLPLASRLSEVRGWAGLAGLLLATAATLLAWTKRPLAAFGAALFFGTLLPAANLLFPIGTIYAERLMYLPAAGVFAVVAGLLSPSPREVRRPSATAWREVLILVSVLSYAVATVARNRVWKDDQTLYADMIRKMPGSAKAHYDFAYDANRRAEKKLARTHLTTAVKIFPRYYDAWALLGKLAWEEKRWDEAVADYRKSVEIFPHYENGRWGLAKTLEEAGRLAEAEKAFDEGAKELPDSYPLAYHRAAFLGKRGRLDEAEKEWMRAVKLSGGAARARLGYAEALDDLGRPDEAIEEARWALARDPSLAEARTFLAECYEKKGKILAAAAELSRAVRSQPENEDLLDDLLDFASRHPEARGRAQTALESQR
jgi:tetratricopeptide (TPR) repeat protein